MLINYIVNRAEYFYDNYGECGDRCNHPAGSCNSDYALKNKCQECAANNAFEPEANCAGCCLECSNEIHYGRSYRNAEYRTAYNCQKLIYYYTCRYSWKYCSEIMYAFEQFDLNKFDHYNVLSLGCGQSPDLMALEQLNVGKNKSIIYTGIDINPYWGILHHAVNEYCLAVENINCNYYESDVITSLQSYFWRANIIVISYLLSSFSDNGRDIMVNQLFDLLISNVVSCKEPGPLAIIINDIDHDKIRKYFDTLLIKLDNAGYVGTYYKKHFKSRNGNDYGDKSYQHEKNVNKFTVPNGLKFNCAFMCTSAQLIVVVEQYNRRG